MAQKMLKVLFVDDEPNLLSAVKRAFYKIQEFKIDTAESGKRVSKRSSKMAPMQ